MGIKTPPAYVHPSKAKRQNAGLKGSTPEAVESAERAKKEKGAESSIASVPGKTKQPSKPSAHTIRLVAHLPKSGVFPIYDKMIASDLSPKKTVLALIGRGFEALDASNLKPASYEFGGETVETNRTFRSEDFSLLSEKFDPFGILSKRALGVKIGEALMVRALKEMADD